MPRPNPSRRRRRMVMLKLPRVIWLGISYLDRWAISQIDLSVTLMMCWRMSRVDRYPMFTVILA